MHCQEGEEEEEKGGDPPIVPGLDISDATREAIAVATVAEALKKEKYALLSKSHHFVPIAVETSGALGPDALSLLTDISRRQQSMTHDHQSLPFLLQRVSIALQHGNVASVLGTTSSM
eukprot:Em0019g670a